MTRLTLVAAVADNGVIGDAGAIPWHIPADFAHFKQLTLGHVLVMGRSTFDSIGRPLPGRTTVVLTRDRRWTRPGVLVAHDLDEAVRVAATVDEELFVAGGAAVYAGLLDRADAQVLTEVHLSPRGDTRYPDFNRAEWVETRREPHLDAEVPHEFVWWERTRPGGPGGRGAAGGQRGG